MLESTFCHIPGVGGLTERALWQQGCLTWHTYLRSPASYRPGGVDRAYFDTLVRKSVDCLKKRDHRFFAQALGAREAWRAWPDFRNHCVYLDIDGKDQEALHLLWYKNNVLVAYTRCFPPGVYFEEPAIGRVLVRRSERMNSYGHEIMKASIEALEQRFPGTSIKLSAQTYLQAFYESHGFQKSGEGYLEDGIPHIPMLRKA